MSNFTGILTTEFKSLFTDAIDELISSTGFAKPCRLIYGETLWTTCPNCVYDAVNNRSSGVYKAGGTLAFYHGVCPFCKGKGRIESDNTETIYLVPLWDYKDWVGWKSGDLTRSPVGYVQTISAMSTITKIKRAKEIVIDTDIEKYAHHKFTRDGEPTPIGFGTDAYIFTMWKAID